MRPLIRPSALRQGDTIGIVAPASHLPHNERHIFFEGIRRLESRGFRVTYDSAILDEHLYLAGPDSQRARIFTDAFLNPEICGVIATRGGYGSQRILPFLNERIIRDNPKIFVGSSDVTSLMIYLQTRCCLVTFYGPMAGSRQFDGENLQSLLDTLNGKKPPVLEGEPLKPGRARGPVVGGCLTGIVHGLGTPYEVDLEGAILLAEEVNEAPYRIDRMLVHLRNAGKLKGVRGIVFGHMPGCDLEGRQAGLLRDVILDVFEESDVPILFGAPIGHGNRTITVPLGVEAVLDCASGKLEFSDAGVF